MNVDLSSIKRQQQGESVKMTNEAPPPTQDLENDLDMSFLNEPMAPSMNDLIMPEPEAPKDPETIAKEGEQKIILLLYYNKFSEDLAIVAQELTNDNLQRLNLEQLKLLREKCDKILGSNSGLEVRRKSFNAMLYVIEKLCCYSGLKCEGLTGQLLADDTYQKDLSRLALKYLSSSECSPEVCVTMKILSSAVQIHANNEIKAQSQQVTQQLSKPDEKLNDNVTTLTSQFKDL
jgi:hypothetical protein